MTEPRIRQVSLPAPPGSPWAWAADLAAAALERELPASAIVRRAPTPGDDLVLCFGGADLERAHAARSRGGSAAIVGIANDLAVPEGWEAHRPDVAIVAHPGLRPLLRRAGLDDPTIVVGGAIVPTAGPTRDDARTRLQVADGERVLLLAARELGGARLQRFMVHLGALPRHVQILCDSDADAAALIGPVARLYGIRVRRVTAPSLLPTALAAADAVAGSPTPSVLLSALASRTPVVLIEPRTREELERAACLEAFGLGKGATQASESPGLVGSALEARNATELARAEGRLASIVDGLLQNRAAIVAWARSRPAAAQPGSTSATVLDDFEDIGASAEEQVEAQEREINREIRAVEVEDELRALKRRLGDA
jgi:hypothetical protein